ncbi:hypothetical protein CDL12_00225 [Handroanthus impetiginosus]|uniref:Uncharacterized protein n=1 Tax=Handroanthus impetiginosus TaxID=429701 RepID=A0A2G9IB86_9LAMI|nr:hypothetical protein CDL12_00225 [Handroanthus impetiginosus]
MSNIELIYIHQRIESPLHALQTPLHWIIPVTPTRFTANEMRHKWPPLITQARMVLLNHLLITIHQTLPKSMQIIGVLNKNLVHPLILLCNQQVYQCRLIVRLKSWPTLQIGR